MSYSVYVDPDLADYIPTFVENRKKELQQAQIDLDGKKLEEAAKNQKSEEISSLFKDMNWLLDHYQVVESTQQPEL